VLSVIRGLSWLLIQTSRFTGPVFDWATLMPVCERRVVALYSRGSNDINFRVKLN
jgi:hypothetical protein